MEALPIFLDRLLNPVAAIVISVTGERLADNTFLLSDVPSPVMTDQTSPVSLPAAILGEQGKCHVAHEPTHESQVARPVVFPERCGLLVLTLCCLPCITDVFQYSERLCHKQCASGMACR
jgi:hypothetical protein